MSPASVACSVEPQIHDADRLRAHALVLDGSRVYAGQSVVDLAGIRPPRP